MSISSPRPAITVGQSGTLLLAAGAGLLVALLPLESTALIVVATVAFCSGLLRPDVLPLVIPSAVVLLPSYVGVIAPGLGFVNVQRVVMYLGSLGLLLWLLRRSPGSGPTPSARRPALKRDSLPLVMLCAGWALALLVSPLNGLGNSVRAANLVLYQGLPFALGVIFVRSEGQLLRVSLAAALATVYVAVFATIDVVTGQSVFAGYVPPLSGLMDGRVLMRRGDLIRAEATLSQPLGLVQVLLLCLPLSAALTRNRRLVPLAAIAVAAGLATMWATHARSAGIAIAGGAVLVFLARHWRSTLLLASGALLIAAVVPSLRSKINVVRAMEESAVELSAKSYSAETEAEFSSAGRVFVIAAGLNAISARPISGYGINASASGAGVPTVDNYFVLLPLDVGAPAAALILCGTVGVWLVVAVRPRRTFWDQILLLAVGAYLVELFFVGLEDSLPFFFVTLGALWSRRGGAVESESRNDA